METALKSTLHPLPIDRRLTPREIQLRLAAIDEALPELKERIAVCSLCPRRCGARRCEGEAGECGLDSRLRVGSVARHYGEEPPISGENGAVNVFFSGCNFHCIHCQNWPISQHHVGKEITAENLADRILKKWRQGAHSFGWVTPTPQIVGALGAYKICLESGFDLPLVHNNGGYEDPEVVRLLTGIVDIWLPDAKTADPMRAKAVQSIGDYPDRNFEAIEAMVEQVRNKDARAVIVRHLVLPDGLEDSKAVLYKLWHNFKDEIYISLMGQYFPVFQTIEHPSLGRRLSGEGYSSIIEEAQSLGFEKGWVQEYESETGVPIHCLP